MTKQANIIDVAGKIHALLADLTPDERVRVVQSALVLFGDSAPPIPTPPDDATGQSKPPDDTNSNAKDYFTQKNPRNKGESLAVAARYLERHEKKDGCTREEMKKCFADGRRNFDGRSFARDIRNATHQAGLFNTGTKKGQYHLSYFGQEYIDALPDLDAVKKLRKPVRKKKPTKAGKKKTAKKT